MSLLFYELRTKISLALQNKTPLFRAGIPASIKACKRRSHGREAVVLYKILKNGK